MPNAGHPIGHPHAASGPGGDAVNRDAAMFRSQTPNQHYNAERDGLVPTRNTSKDLHADHSPLTKPDRENAMELAAQRVEGHGLPDSLRVRKPTSILANRG